jgi:hypothetical protein
MTYLSVRPDPNKVLKYGYVYPVPAAAPSLRLILLA